MIGTLLASATIGSLLWLDRVFMFQVLVSRPIVMAPLLGLIMGNIHIGLLVGASLELLWLNAPPVGAYLPSDDSYCAAVSVPVAVYSAAYVNDLSAAGFALVLCLPFSLLGRTVDTHIRSLNETLLPQDLSNMESLIGKAMLTALIRAYTYALLSMVGSVCLGIAIVWAAKDILPAPVFTACSFMPFASIVIGIAGLLAKDIPSGRQTGLFVLGMSVVVIVTWIL
ncbi:MAG: PTS sugar transporter subunit IIC [Desulfomonilia bacterium]